MLTTITGTFNNGIIVLNEQAPTTKASKVLITFTEEIAPADAIINIRKPGFAKGTFINVATDFDAPLDELNDYI